MSSALSSLSWRKYDFAESMVELSEGANLRDALEKLKKALFGEENAKYEEREDHEDNVLSPSW